MRSCKKCEPLLERVRKRLSGHELGESTSTKTLAVRSPTSATSTERDSRVPCEPGAAVLFLFKEPTPGRRCSLLRSGGAFVRLRSFTAGRGNRAADGAQAVAQHIRAEHVTLFGGKLLRELFL